MSLTGTWLETASTKSSLTHSMEPSSTHCKHLDYQDFFLPPHEANNITEYSLLFRFMAFFLIIKTQCASKQRYVRLNKDWCPVVFLLCPVLLNVDGDKRCAEHEEIL